MVLTLELQASGAVVFRDELPVPEANIAVYEQIYVLEQWHRRLLLAALMTCHGHSWQGSLPPDLLRSLKARLRQLDGRVHLDCENSRNVIWLLTLEELHTLLLADGAWPTVKALTGLPRAVLDSKLRELREIRNVVGHNRAVSAGTAVLAAGIAVALQSGIDRFKTHVLYDEDSKVHVSEDETEGVPGRFASRIAGNDWKTFQPMLTEGEHFYGLTRLPVEPFDSFLSIRRFLHEIRPVETDVLAVLVNRSGDEFTIVWPKRSTDVVHERVMQFFFTSHHACWTQTPYEQQHASAVCDPRIWFYENQRPASE